MRAVLEFDLNDLDDTMAHKRCVKATDMACALFEITSNLKRRCEVLVDNKPMNAYEAMDMVFECIADELLEHNIILDDLIN